MAAHSDSATSSDSLAALGRKLYARALVSRDQELITDPRGQPISWLLDTRIPMLDAELFQEVGQVMAKRIADRKVHQVVGFGFGAYAMVCAVLSQPGYTFKGGLVREARKSHGRRRLVEGPLDRSKPIVLMDDILNSGRSAARALALLRSDGFQVVGVQALFNFTWSTGKARLEAEHLWVDALLDLHLKSDKPLSGSSSDTR